MKRNKLIDIENKLQGEQSGKERINQEFGIRRYKLLYIINKHKVLLLGKNRKRAPSPVCAHTLIFSLSHTYTHTHLRSRHWL